MIMSKICFLVGHGISSNGVYDPGAVSGKYEEFKIAKEIGKYAQEYYNKTYSEKADLMNYKGNLCLQDRIDKCKDDTYDFIAEIHLNAGGGRGVECYYKKGNAKGQKYADTICDYISDALAVPQRPNWTDEDGGDKVKLAEDGTDYFGIIRRTKPTAVLIETVFIDTVSDLAAVKTAAGQKKCGEAIAKAVAKVRGVKKKAATSSFKEYKVKVIADKLNIRKTPKFVDSDIVGAIKDKGIYTIVAEKTVSGIPMGKLKSGQGWVSLRSKYVKKL
jgi:N-acetylmuramoyl-L-alanine amidase